MKTLIIVILVILIAVPILAFFVPYTKNEILTYQHGKDFVGLGETAGERPSDFLKVLYYSPPFARVYYVKRGDYGEIINFEMKNGQWNFINWEAAPAWSATGSNDRVIWPYYFDYYGFGLIMIIGIMGIPYWLMILIFALILRHLILKENKSKTIS